MSESTSSQNNNKEIAKGITRISVSGYKSLYDECSIEVRPLTILAGANSSGKSSIMQPLLLMKQTLEATYDPGALLLNGPNVKFTSAKQLFSKITVSLPNGHKTTTVGQFKIKLELEDSKSIISEFAKIPKKAIIEIIKIIISDEDKYKFSISHDMLSEDIKKILPKQYIQFCMMMFQEGLKNNSQENELIWLIRRNRCFFEFILKHRKKLDIPLQHTFRHSLLGLFERHISEIIHIPGLRGNPERNYKTTAIGDEFPGTFDNYVASIIKHWQKTRDKRLKELGNALETLGLTCKVQAKQVDDTQVELRVGRLPHHSNNKNDMVSIADVGFGVSQTLPVIVALLVAEPGQLVYLEQPEIHLHPRAQVALAEILANAANRGVKVVLETHSDRLLLAIQSLVAEGKLSPDLVKLHWFTRQEDGTTKVSSADLDETGAFGDWPEDFGDISLKLESRYLDAAEARLFKEVHGS
jgi:predicted ATPase